MICPRCQANLVPDGLNICPICFITATGAARTLVCEIIDYLRKWAEYEQWCGSHGRSA